MPLIKLHCIRQFLGLKKIEKAVGVSCLFFFFLSAHTLYASPSTSRGSKKISTPFLPYEKSLPIKEEGIPIVIRHRETVAIEFLTLKRASSSLNIPKGIASLELIVLSDTFSLKGYNLAYQSSIPKLSTPTLKTQIYDKSKKDQKLAFSQENYPDYSPSSSNWWVDYTLSFQYYREALETKRLFRQDPTDLSSNLSSFIVSSTSKAIESIEWNMMEKFNPHIDLSQDSSFLVRGPHAKTSFKAPRVFSVDQLYHNESSFPKWAFAWQDLRETRSLFLFPESLKNTPILKTSYTHDLINSYLKETGFSPIKVYTQNEPSLSIDYTKAILSVESDLSQTKIGQRLSLIGLFPISDQFYISALERDPDLTSLNKPEMEITFLSNKYLDRELIFPDELDFYVLPPSVQFPVRYKKIEEICYLTLAEFQSISIDFELATLSLRPKKVSPDTARFCFLSTYKGEDIEQNFTIPHLFSSNWNSFISLHDKNELSFLKLFLETSKAPTPYPNSESEHSLFILSSSIEFKNLPKGVSNPTSLHFTPVSNLEISYINPITYIQDEFLFETYSDPETKPFFVSSTNTMALSFGNTIQLATLPSRESLEAVPLFTNLSIGDNYNALLLHTHSEFYLPFIDKENTHLFSLYGAVKINPLSTDKKELGLTPCFSSTTFLFPVKTPTLFSSPSIPPVSASHEKVDSIYSFLAKGKLSITESTNPLESDRYASSLVRILPDINLLQTTPFDPLFLSSNASIEINHAHRMIYFELASIPSLAELDTDSLGDDFLVEAKITPQMNEDGYLFSLKLKATDVTFLPPEKHHVLFILDRNSSIEKHRYDIYKKSLVQSLTYLDPHTLFNIYFFDNGPEKMSPHDLKPTKTAELFAQKFLQGSPQVKGSSFADFITLMQEIKKIASQSNDLYSVILLSNGGSMKNIRLNRESLRELLWNWPDSLSLYTTAISDNNNLPMLELLAKIGKGELSLAKTHSAFGRKLCTLVRHISKPVAHGIAVTALSDDPNLTIEFSNDFSGQLFADRSFAIYGKSTSLCSIDLLLQGRRENRFINLRKRISLKDAEKGKGSIEKEFYSHKAVHELISFIFSNDQTHLLNAKNYLAPFNSPLTSQL